MSYSQQAAAVAQQMVNAADHPTRVQAALDIIRRLVPGAEITSDGGGTIIYIPRAR